MYLLGMEYTPIHNFMRRLRIRPYAIFPAPDPNTLAVYFHDEEGPAIILVRYLRTWRWAWWRLESPPAEEWQAWAAEEEEKVAQFRQTGEELVHRLNCPVARVVIITGPIKYKSPFTEFLQRVRDHGITLVDLSRARQMPDLEWRRPEPRAESIPLPPFPDRTFWRASIDPAWWQERLSGVATPDAHQRKEASRSVALRALEFMKEAPARILVEGSAILAAPHAVLSALPGYIDRPAGRRYLLWTGAYLAGACMADPHWEEQSESIVLGYLNFLLDQMERWSSRERRVVLRGLQMLAQKSVDHDLPRETAIAQFFQDLFPSLMHDDFLAHSINRGRWGWRLRELSETLARCGYITPSTWREQWSRHRLRGEILNSVHRGLLNHLVWSADPETRQALAWIEVELKDAVMSRLGWHLHDNDLAPAFWDLVAQDDRLLASLAEAAVERQAKSEFPPSDEALQHLIPLIQQRLGESDLPAWIRSRLEEALSRLLPGAAGSLRKDRV